MTERVGVEERVEGTSTPHTNVDVLAVDNVCLDCRDEDNKKGEW